MLLILFFTLNRAYVPVSALAYIGNPVIVVMLSQAERRFQVREKWIEQKLVQEVRRSGGLALKFVSPGFNGVPDRLLLFMGGNVAFAEVKAPGQKPRPLQVRRMEQLRKLGLRVYVIDGVEQIGRMIDEICAS